MRKTKPWNVMDYIKTKEQLDAYVDAAVEPYKKALNLAREALLEINGYDVSRADHQSVRTIFVDCNQISYKALIGIDEIMKKEGIND